MQLFQHPPKHFVKLHVQMSGCSLYEVKCYVPNTNTRKTHGKVALSTPRLWGGYTWGLGVPPAPGSNTRCYSQSRGAIRLRATPEPGSNTMVTPKPEELPGGHIEGAHSVPTVLAS